MKAYLVFIFALWTSVPRLLAQNSFADANRLYDDAKYKQAAELFRQTCAEYPASAEIWYNLGNSYYKSGKIGFAIAAYRKALKLSPRDADIRYNLDFVFAKSSDRIEPAPREFVIRQTDLVADVFTSGEWALGATVLGALALGCFLLYIFLKNYRVKRAGLILSVICWLGAFVFTALAAHRYYYALDSYVVVVSNAAGVSAEPTENGTRLLLLNEGATLKLEGRENNWIKVELPDGSKGYVPEEKVQVI